MNLLVIGDVVGRPGRRALSALLPGLRRELDIHLVIANGENLAGGHGMTPETVEDVFSAGVDVLTGGNHTFDKKDAVGVVKTHPRVIRPANYPPGTPGRGVVWVDVPGGLAGVTCLLGRVFMSPVDDPFRAADTLAAEAKEAGARYFIVDMHGEASSEKMAMGWYMDGRASVVAGSHTHVPTADARVLHRGTAYITDVGMTGPYDSIIGMDKKPVLANFLTGLRHRFKPASGDIRLYALHVELDENTGRALSLTHLYREFKEQE